MKKVNIHDIVFDSQTINTVSEVIRGFPANQEYFSQVNAPSTPPRYVLHYSCTLLSVILKYCMAILHSNFQFKKMSHPLKVKTVKLYITSVSPDRVQVSGTFMGVNSLNHQSQKYGVCFMSKLRFIC